MSKNKKTKQLDNLSPKKYTIYGIFNFKTNTLIYVNMDEEQAELEFDISGYTEGEFDIVSFDVIIA